MKKHLGFTLTEPMIVVVIVGILIAVAFAGVQNLYHTLPDDREVKPRYCG